MDEVTAGACPESLLPGGDPAIRGEDTSPGGFPKDLSCMNITSWANLIQDVAEGMKVVPPTLSMEVCLEAMVLLQLLEATTGMGYCRICCQPSPRCHCGDDPQYAPTETWSQLMARMPGQGGVASIGGPTTPGTATTGVQEWGVPSPPPGLPSPDFNWSLPLLEAPATEGLPMPSGGPPGIGKQTTGPWALGQKAPAPPMQVPSTPQGMLPLHQQRPHQPAAPHEQPVQPSNQPATPCSHPGGQQEGDCWLNLLQTEPLLPLTLPTQTEEGNRLGDGASEAGRPVTPDGDEG